MGHTNFQDYAEHHDVVGLASADRKSAEYLAVAEWLDSRENDINVAAGVA